MFLFIIKSFHSLLGPTTASPLPPTLPPTVSSSESTTPSDTDINVTEDNDNMSQEGGLGSDEDSKSIEHLNNCNKAFDCEDNYSRKDDISKDTI